MLKVLKRYKTVSILILLCFFSAFIAFNNGLLNILKANEIIKLNNEYKYINSIDVKIKFADILSINDLKDITKTDKCNIYLKNFPIYFKEIDNMYIPQIILVQNEELSLPTSNNIKKLNKNEIIVPSNCVDMGKEKTLTFQNSTLIIKDSIRCEKYPAFSSLFVINADDYFNVNKDILKTSNEISLEIVSNKYDVEECFFKIKKNLKSTSKNSLISYRKINDSKNIFNNVLSQSNVIAIGLFFFALLNTIIISYYWIAVRKREIAIRKSFGFTNYQILKIIFKELFQLILLSTLCSLIVQVFFNLDFLSILDIPNVLLLSFILFVCIILSVVISMIIPIKYILSIEPAQGVNL